MNKLDPQTSITGTEDLRVGDFWGWAYSDILSNRNRGIFAEFLVGSALQVLDSPRVEWDSTDLYYREKKIEVKSAGYCQSWAQKAPSKIVFNIAEAYGWDAATNTYQIELARSSDCYVFCIYKETDCERARDNLLNVASWDFYVSATEQLTNAFKKQRSVSLKPLQKLCSAVTYDNLKAEVDLCLSLRSQR